jgi:hypothetical protein
MDPEELKTLIETVISNKIKYFWVYILLSGIFGIAAAYSIEYFKNKGKNLATKQDIEEITKKVEGIKADIKANQEVETQKRQLKYNALMNSLKMIDAHLSNFLVFKDGTKINKQYASVSEVRECQNSLILTCDNPKVIEKFHEILFAKSGLDSEQVNKLLLSINEYRNLVRDELGFGAEIELDKNNIWIPSINFAKE